MNIFIFHKNIESNVKMYCDKHVIKMILETNQLLSTAYRVLTSQEKDDIRVYKLNHLNHPCSVWARTSKANYWYLVDLYYALHDEWNYRYNHNKIHASMVNMELIENIQSNLFPAEELTPFVQCMPKSYRQPDTILAYRDYFSNEKHNLMSWKNRPIPNWIILP